MFSIKMLQFLSFLWVVLRVSSIESNHHLFRTDYTYYKEIDVWMKFHNIPANWHEAQLRCHLEGATLASPTSEAMTAVMAKAMKGKTSNVFTGFHATFSKGDYYSIEGVPLPDDVTWAPNEPDNEDDNESCIGSYNDGVLFDVNCSEAMTFVCYKKYDQELKWNQQCETTDPEYKFEPETGSCYKFHRTPRTWSRAYMACSAEGGHLAIINSVKEANVLSRIFSSISTKTIRIIKNQVLAFIGFHDWGEHGSWLTIHGQTLEQAGYSRWGKVYNEPNNVTDASTNNEGEYCGSIFQNGDLNDLWCEYVISFICEKKPSYLTTNKLQ